MVSTFGWPGKFARKPSSVFVTTIPVLRPRGRRGQDDEGCQDHVESTAWCSSSLPRPARVAVILDHAARPAVRRAAPANSPAARRRPPGCAGRGWAPAGRIQTRLRRRSRAGRFRRCRPRGRAPDARAAPCRRDRRRADRGSPAPGPAPPRTAPAPVSSVVRISATRRALVHRSTHASISLACRTRMSRVAESRLVSAGRARPSRGRARGQRDR